MNKLQHTCALSEKAVQKVARENIKIRKTRGKSTRKANTKVTTSHWSDGLDPRVVAQVKALHIPRVHTRIEVISPTEVVIHNPGWKK